MRGLLRVLILQCTLGWPLAAAGAAADAPRFQKEIEALLAGNHAAQAYEALAARPEYAGESWYDVLVAQAALGSGRTDEAVARLERHVAAHPQQDPPQLLLARAYEQQGRPDRAAAQYRRVEASSPFEGSREAARTELARLGAPGGAWAQATAPKSPAPGGFGDEDSGIIGDVFLGAGFDSNANSGTDAERYFYYELSREQRDSKSAYATVGASLAGSRALGETLAWRNGVAASAAAYPSAHFADTQDASAQTQLRWTGRRQRVSAGLAASVQAIDERRSDEAVAAGLKLETLLGTRLLSLAAETARLRFPHAPLRDVDTVFVRAELTRAPREDLRWQPRVGAVYGVERAQAADSPFGRRLWGLVLGGEERFGPRLVVDGEVGYLQSKFDEPFLAASRRSDDTVQARLYWHFKMREQSRWEHSLGGRFRYNNSNEPLYEFDRFVVGYEVAGTWGKKE